jgi:hypothetical protein
MILLAAASRGASCGASVRLWPFLWSEKPLYRKILIINEMKFLDVAFYTRRSKNSRGQLQPKSVVDDAHYPNGQSRAQKPF